MKLLLHVCCGPCSTHVINVLKQEYDVTLYFYNPNIHPKAEYEKRLDEAKKVADTMDLPLIEGPYDPEVWFDKIKGLEHEPENGKRCPVCFDLRLKKTAEYADEHGFDLFTTTLTVSPYKDAEKVNESGLKFEIKAKFLGSNFKKKDGYRKSIQLSNEMGLYRQHYCGCVYSKA